MSSPTTLSTVASALAVGADAEAATALEPGTAYAAVDNHRQDDRCDRPHNASTSMIAAANIEPMTSLRIE